MFYTFIKRIIFSLYPIFFRCLSTKFRVESNLWLPREIREMNFLPYFYDTWWTFLSSLNTPKCIINVSKLFSMLMDGIQHFDISFILSAFMKYIIISYYKNLKIKGAYKFLIETKISDIFITCYLHLSFCIKDVIFNP